MNSPYTNLEFDRFKYRQGQLLASRDFRDRQQMEDALRWMHNSSDYHNAWGIAIGYEISLSGDAQNNWGPADTLTISPGIAYDCYGRELILRTPRLFTRDILETLRAPEDPSRDNTFYLVIRYLIAKHGKMQSYCSGSPNSFIVPEPIFCWKEKCNIQFGIEVPILAVTFTETGNGAIATVERYLANRVRPLARPRFAFGQTIRSRTPWQLWQYVPPASSPGTSAVALRIVTINFGLEVKLDTSDAGFKNAPCFFAWLSGDLGSTGKDILTPFISLTDERADGFTLRALFHNFQNSSGRLQGKAANKSGNPLTGVSIDIAQISVDANVVGKTKTDANGNYVVEVPPGIYDVNVSYPNYTNKIYNVEIGILHFTTELNIVIPNLSGQRVSETVKWINPLPMIANKRQLTVCWIGIECDQPILQRVVHKEPETPPMQ